MLDKADGAEFSESNCHAIKTYIILARNEFFFNHIVEILSSTIKFIKLLFSNVFGFFSPFQEKLKLK